MREMLAGWAICQIANHMTRNWFDENAAGVRRPQEESLAGYLGVSVEI